MYIFIYILPHALCDARQSSKKNQQQQQQKQQQYSKYQKTKIKINKRKTTQDLKYYY
jgi:hypothetical protein